MKTKRVTLSEVKGGETFEFGGVEYVKKNHSEIYVGLVYCHTSNSQNAVFIADTAEVLVTDPNAENPEEMQMLSKSPFMQLAHKFVNDAAPITNSDDNETKALLIVAFDESVDAERALSVAFIGGATKTLKNGLYNVFTDQEDETAQVITQCVKETFIDSIADTNPFAKAFSEFKKTGVCNCPRCTEKRAEAAQKAGSNPNVN